jgi:hypothetical protein
MTTTQTSADILKHIREDLKKIVHFTAEEHQAISRKTTAIDIQTVTNNKKTELFLELKKRKPEGPNTLSVGVEILGENIQIHHQKFVVVQGFLDDIYGRIGRLAKHVDTLIGLLEDHPKTKETIHE